MTSHPEPNGRLALALILLSVFSFTGWYTAESDNAVLRKDASKSAYSEVCHADT